jgi:hypothetical protein
MRLEAAYLAVQQAWFDRRLSSGSSSAPSDFT